MVFGELTLEFEARNFDISLCEEALRKVDADCTWNLSESLYIAGSEQEEKGNLNDANILRLFAGAMSMMLDKVSQTDPFSPVITFANGAHTPKLEDFEVRELLFFESIIEKITDVRLKARIADILWSSGNKNLVIYKRYELAVIAIESYMSMPLNPDTWSSDVGACWSRCSYLVMLYQGRGGELKTRLEEKLKHAFLDNSVDLTNYLYELAEIVDCNSLLIAEREELAKHLEKVGDVFLEKKKFSSAIRCFKLAAKWFEKRSLDDDVARLIIKQVETYVEECEFAEPLFIDLNMGNAISTLKQLKHRYRLLYNFNDRLVDLRSKRFDARDDAVSRMATYSQSIDVYPYVQDAIKFVEGRNKWAAFIAFMKIAHPFNKCDEEQKWKIEDGDKTRLLDLFSHVAYQEGNRHLGVFPTTINEDSSNRTLETFLRLLYKNHVGLNSLSRILPALDVIHAEHYFSERDFEEIVSNCPLIPHNRKKLFAKALHAGYEHDYVVSFHILAPQIEYMICVYLRERGIDTTILKEDGREDDKSLSALLKMRETINLMGENICYEIDSLFCNHSGFNIRNDVAHGKFSDDDWQSCTFAYAWWYILRLIFINSNVFYVWRLKR